VEARGIKENENVCIEPKSTHNQQGQGLKKSSALNKTGCPRGVASTHGGRLKIVPQKVRKEFGVSKRKREDTQVYGKRATPKRSKNGEKRRRKS